ncbi:hypothetical protein HMPREF0293_1518 [Corynebacterium glucuronolyticum ATCC 51866]|uniref:CsbD-like protein n=1 Tax=Corynebacterium glucuronolyticum ATCC 51866 TaxID=548478 RepID=A0ABP2DY88_9CORY|nr:hypothetical protein HMPREF0293_1518 [Corynebacterium glucuronolyticum ATCC 51866]
MGVAFLVLQKIAGAFKKGTERIESDGEGMRRQAVGDALAEAEDEKKPHRV